MSRNRRQNPVLIEILIVLMFFALSACVLLGLFASAYKEGERALSESEALIWTENFVERFCASSLGADEYLRQEGFEAAEKGYSYARRFSKSEYEFYAAPFDEAYSTGILSGFTLTAKMGDIEVYSLPASHFYMPRGLIE